MTLDSWLDYISQIHHQEIDLGLTRIGRVARPLGLTKLPFPVITVAGTNGKGSTVTLLENIYLTEGHSVCAITSPHLNSFNERLRINGVNASDETLCAAFEKINQARGDISLSYFEFTHLALLLIINEIQPDIALIEVGLGGRLDASNITDPDCAVITSISLDHTERLGNTREKIGYEKAGILRDNIPFICGDLDTPQSVIDSANAHHCQTFYATKNFTYAKNGATWFWSHEDSTLNKLPSISLPLQNASTALMTLTAMKNTLPVSEASIRAGLQSATMPGRFEIIKGEVATIFDVAHNPAASQLLAENIQSLKPTGNVIAVFSILKDKDINNTIAPMLPIVSHWFIAEIQNNDRAAPLQMIQNALEGKSNYTCCASLQSAQDQAKQMAKSNDLIIIFGSFHVWQK